MALFELNQKYENAADGWKPPTFKDCAAADISLAFFDDSEHAERRTVDGKESAAGEKSGCSAKKRETTASFSAGFRVQVE